MENVLLLGKLFGIHSAASHIVLFCDMVSSETCSDFFSLLWHSHYICGLIVLLCQSVHFVQCETCHYIIVLSEPDNDLFLSEFCVYHSCVHVLVLVQTLQSLLYKVFACTFLNEENIGAA